MLTQKEISVLDYFAFHSQSGESIILNPSDTICGLSNEVRNLVHLFSGCLFIHVRLDFHAADE